jgi:hypothetical protein
VRHPWEPVRGGDVTDRAVLADEVGLFAGPRRRKREVLLDVEGSLQGHNTDEESFSMQAPSSPVLTTLSNRTPTTGVVPQLLIVVEHQLADRQRKRSAGHAGGIPWRPTKGSARTVAMTACCSILGHRDAAVRPGPPDFESPPGGCSGARAAYAGCPVPMPARAAPTMPASLRSSAASTGVRRDRYPKNSSAFLETPPPRRISWGHKRRSSSER